MKIKISQRRHPGDELVERVMTEEAYRRATKENVGTDDFTVTEEEVDSLDIRELIRRDDECARKAWPAGEFQTEIL